MKKYLIFLLLLSILLSECKKKNDTGSSGSGGWSSDDWTFYNNVLSLQTKAGRIFDSLSGISDSLTALNKVQQFFAGDPSVTSAITGSQGITVQYNNGMRGGIFLNPEDSVPYNRKDRVDSHNLPLPTSNPYSRVNNKKAIFLNPTYWERAQWADKIVQNYAEQLPKIGFAPLSILQNATATIDQFTQLSGYGIIHIYSHGIAWPDKNNINDVYLLTGEEANVATSTKYGDEIKKGNIIIVNGHALGGLKNMYLVSEQFLASHNDFSKDTILFYGGFCFSFCGSWPVLQSNFAQGAYFGFTWEVQTEKNANWNISLMDSLCDTTMLHVYHPLQWIMGTNPAKSYWNGTDQKTVFIRYEGDDGLALWRLHYIHNYSTRTITRHIPAPPSGDFIVTTQATLSGASFRVVDTGSISQGILFFNIPNNAKDSSYNLTVSLSNLAASWTLPEGWSLKLTQVTFDQTGQQTISLGDPPWNTTLQFNVAADADYWDLSGSIEVLKADNSIYQSESVSFSSGAMNPDGAGMVMHPRKTGLSSGNRK